MRARVVRAPVLALAVALTIASSLIAQTKSSTTQKSYPKKTAESSNKSARKAATPNAATRNVPARKTDAPKAGALFRVAISNATCATVSSATVAGEPIHMHRSADSSYALAAVPIDSTDGVSLVVRCANGDSTSTRIHTLRSTYPLERLRVAPKFGAEPDSALAARLKRESDQAAAVSRNAHETPRLWINAFMVPRESRVTSGFGGGRTFNGTVTSRHMGTDYAGAVGAPVRAANRGIVRLTGDFYLGGNVIYLDHGEGVVTAYLHLSKQLVAVGDTVQQGDIIGRVGATGRVTGPHLHFIARYGAITVDAASLYSVTSADKKP